MAFIHIGDGDDPAILLAEERIHVAFALPADADAAHDDLLGRSVGPKQAGRDEGGCGSEQPGLKGLAASQSRRSHGRDLLMQGIGEEGPGKS